MGSRQFLHLRGFQVSTDPQGLTIELLIRGFRDQEEIEAFVLRLRAFGLLNILAPPEEEAPELRGAGANDS